HFFWSIAFILEAPFYLLINKKLVFTFHNDRPHKSNSLTFRPFRFIYKICQKAVFVSETVQNRFIENYRIKDTKKIKLIQHGTMPISLNSLRTQKTSSSLHALEKKIIFWGTVKPYKGIDLFLKLREHKYFDDFKLEIYGKWDKELYPLKKSLEALDVHIVDKYLPANFLSKVLETNGIFILPYSHASQSGVLYTLLWYKKIFISTNTGDNASFLSNSNLEKLIFTRENVNELINSIEYCLKNHISITKKLEIRSKEFDWSNVLKSSKEVYLLDNQA
ncbi:MAG: glycosyltransferase, partial [Bacteroidota bacterium]